MPAQPEEQVLELAAALVARAINRAIQSVPAPAAALPAAAQVPELAVVGQRVSIPDDLAAMAGIAGNGIIWKVTKQHVAVAYDDETWGENSSERRQNSSERRQDTYMCISQGVSEEDTHESSCIQYCAWGDDCMMLLKSIMSSE